MNTLALDLSKSRTGWALLFDGDIRNLFDEPGKWQILATWKITKFTRNWLVFGEGGAARSVVFGNWVLGSEQTSRGQVFNCLQRRLATLHDVIPFQRVFPEEPITPDQLQGYTTIGTLRLTMGLIGATEDFCFNFRATADFPEGVRFYEEVNVSNWRSDFIGKLDNDQAKAAARRLRKEGHKSASATDKLKKLVMARAKQYGFSPRFHDESDALGVLTYGLLKNGVKPPWLNDEVLRQPLAVLA